MAKINKRPNPFYLLLIAAGVSFTITACAFGVMTMRQTGSFGATGYAESEHGMLGFLARYGMHLLIVQLIILAIATFGAIGTDGYWNRK